MWKLRIGTLALLGLLAACVQLPPTPEDLQAKKFNSAPPGKGGSLPGAAPIRIGATSRPRCFWTTR